MSKAWLKYFYETFVLNLNILTSNPSLRQAANRYAVMLKKPANNKRQKGNGQQ